MPNWKFLSSLGLHLSRFRASAPAGRALAGSYSTSQTAQVEARKTTSTAEYLVAEIKSHPRALMFVLGVIGLAALATVADRGLSVDGQRYLLQQRFHVLRQP